MDTLDKEEPASQEPDTDTPATDSTEETAESDTSTDGSDAAKLQKRLADKDRYIKELESKKAKVPDNRSEEIKDLEWKLENKDRISLVKDEYDKILAEGYEGEKVSKKIALELAEKQAKVDSSGTKRKRQDDMNTPSVTNRRATNLKGFESPEDEALGLTIEKKRKLEARHPHLLLDK